MPTRTWAVQKDARIAESGDLGAGASSYSPVGYYSGYKYRTLIDFAQNWDDMVTVTKAVIKMKVSSQYYVAFSSDPDIEVRRLAESWSEGTSSGLSGSNAVTWSNQPSTTGSSVTVDISTTEGTWVTIDVTSIMYALGSSVYGFQLRAASEASGGDVTEFYSRESSYDPYMEITYTTAPANTAPKAPTGLSPFAAPPGVVMTGLTPTFGFTHSDSDGDALLDYDLQVSTDSLFTTATHWNIAAQTLGKTGNVVSRVYAGTALTRGTQYYWRARTSSAAGVLTEGAWSQTGVFRVGNLPTAVLTSPSATDALVKMVKVAGSGVDVRMVIEWTFNANDVGQTQSTYQVVVLNDNNTPFWSDAVPVSSVATSVTVPTSPTRGNFYKVQVTVTDSGGDTASSAQVRCKAQWGFAEYKTIDLGVVTAWAAVANSDTVVETPQRQLVVTEYAVSSDGGAISAANWKSVIPPPMTGVMHSWFHWRVFLFAWSGQASPVFKSMALTYSSDALVTPDGWSITSQHVLDQGVRVYGTQSLRADCDGTLLRAYQPVHVEKNTRYRLSGRIKSDLNTGARIGIVAAPADTILLASSPVVTQTQGWEREATDVWDSLDRETAYVVCDVSGAAPNQAWFDAMKLEASTVVTAWTPGFVGPAVTIDAGGLQVDGSADAILRLKGGAGTARDVVELGEHGLMFGGGEVEVYSAADGVLTIGGSVVVGNLKPKLLGYSGSGTWTKPVGLSYIVVEVIGGGGGSGGVAATGAGQASVGGGGGGGGYARARFDASVLPATCAVTVGAAGAAGAAGANNGGTGGTSSFAGTGITTLQATGGGGGPGGAASSGSYATGGGGGGTGSGGEVNARGQGGGSGNVAAGSRLATAFGGSSILGGGYASSYSANTPSSLGAGASGGTNAASDSAGTGAAGSGGAVYVTEYYL